MAPIQAREEEPEDSARATVPGPESARRDAALNVFAATPLLATREWPEPVRSSLAERRTINLRASSFGESILYFGPERRR